MNWWEAIVSYYKTIGEKYSVDPVVFVGIHIAATPLFAAAVWWLVYNRRKKRLLITPIIVAAFIFNAANIYLIFFGEGIPWWIYVFVGATTLLSGYVSIKKIKSKLKKV